MNTLPAKPNLPDPSDILADLEAMPVTADNYGEICESVIEAKTKLKEIKAKEKELTDPIKQALKVAQSWFTGPKKTYERIEQILKAKIAEHQGTLQLVKRQAVLAIAQGSVDARHTLAEMSDPVQPLGIQTREVWDMEIVDVSKIPASFWIIDEGKLRSFASTGIEVPGVRYFKRPVIAVSTG